MPVHQHSSKGSNSSGGKSKKGAKQKADDMISLAKKQHLQGTELINIILQAFLLRCS
jgi:hypothetical protein